MTRKQAKPRQQGGTGSGSGPAHRGGGRAGAGAFAPRLVVLLTVLLLVTGPAQGQPIGGACQLSNGTGDGSVQLTVSVVGAFGTNVIDDDEDATYDPVGSIEPATTVYESDLYWGLLGNFLGSAGSQLVDAAFVECTATLARSKFSFQEIDVLLTQSLAAPAGGSALTQTYRITNNGDAPADFTLVRHLDGDLDFDMVINDSGGASSDGRIVFEFDSADNPNAPATFVGIQNSDDQVHDGYTIRRVGFAVQPFPYSELIVGSGGIPAADLDSVAGDSNGDGLTDDPYDVTLSLENRLTIAPGQSGLFVTSTNFGAVAPREALNCNDGADNDADGLIDCADPDCACNDANPCTDDVCDPDSHLCSYPDHSDPCDDGDACTQVDTCQAGACVGASPVVCMPLGQCRDPGVCDPATGECSQPAKPDGTACDDGNACTLGDTCSGGSCRSSTPKNCADGNPCTDDVCNPSTGACSNPPNSAPCNDGNLCTVNDACAGGSCQPGAARICPPDTNGCTDAACDPAGGCTQRPSPDGTRCKTAVGCVRGTCAAGACEPASDCFCDDAADCVDDGDVCNGTESCTGGECVLGAPLACTADDDPCTQAACDPVTGCGQTPAPDGTQCETEGGCTVGTCAAGACTLGASCRCTVDGECNDGNVCNGTETCDVAAGACRAGLPLECNSDANTCTAEVCDRVAGCVSQVTAEEGEECQVDRESGCVSGFCTAAGACVEDPDCNVVFTVAQDVVEIASNAKSATIRTTCSGEPGDQCAAQGFFESPPAAGAQRDASVAVTAAAANCANVTRDTAITKPAKKKIKKSGQAKLKLKLNPIGKCLLRQAGTQGLRVRVSGSVTPKAGGETKLLDILVRVVRR